MNHTNATRVNKGHKHVVFEPNDWVWVHRRKEWFLTRPKTKLDLRGDRPFQLLKHNKNYSYQIDPLDEYNVSANFNVANLSPFDIADLTMNPSKEEGMIRVARPKSKSMREMDLVSSSPNHKIQIQAV